MPPIEEVEYYLRGIWMLLTGRLDGLKRLDFSEHGFWRSWWAIVYCLPPILLDLAGTRMLYLAIMPEGTRAGVSFVTRLALIDVGVWIASYVALTLIMSAAGFRNRLVPAIIAVNWLAVPVQWCMIPLSLVQIFAPENTDLYLCIGLAMLLAWTIAHFMVLRGFVDGKALPTAALLLGMMVASLWASYSLGALLDISIS